MNGPSWGHHIGATKASDGSRDSNLSTFASIIPLDVGNTVCREAALRGTGGETEWVTGINFGHIRDKGG